MLNTTDDVLTIKDVQRILKIGKNNALKLLQEDDLHSFRVGNSYRIMREELVAFIQRHRKY